MGELLGSELGCSPKPYQEPGCCDWWGASDTPYSKDQGCASNLLPGGNQGGNLLSKEKFCPCNCRELLLPCVSLAVILCKKAAAGQVRAVPVWGAPAKRPPGRSQTAPSALGARRKLSWALHWSSSITIGSVLTWECCSSCIQDFLPTAFPEVLT